MPEVGSGEPQVSSLSKISIVEQIEVRLQLYRVPHPHPFVSLLTYVHFCSTTLVISI